MTQSERPKPCQESEQSAPDERFAYKSRRKDQKKKSALPKGGGPSILVYVKDNPRKNTNMKSTHQYGSSLQPTLQPMDPLRFPFQYNPAMLFGLPPFLPPQLLQLPAQQQQRQRYSSNPTQGVYGGGQQPPTTLHQQQYVSQAWPTIPQQQQAPSFPGQVPVGGFAAERQFPTARQTPMSPATQQQSSTVQYPPRTSYQSSSPLIVPRQSEVPVTTAPYIPSTPVSEVATDAGYPGRQYAHSLPSVLPSTYPNYYNCTCQQCLYQDSSSSSDLQDQTSPSGKSLSEGSNDSGYYDSKSFSFKGQKMSSPDEKDAARLMVYCDQNNPTFCLDPASLSHVMGMAQNLERYEQAFIDEKRQIRKKIPCRNLSQNGSCQFGEQCWFNHQVVQGSFRADQAQ